MSDVISIALLLLAFGTAYLLVSRNVSIKRWMLPLTTAGLAAISGLLMATASGGTFTDYTMGLPLGMAAGLLLYHLFDYCRECGSTKAMRGANHESDCGGCGQKQRQDG
jgi:hypothetical protein